MLASTSEKLLVNQLLDIIGKSEFDPFEKSELVNELIFLRRSQCEKCGKKITRSKVTASKGENAKFWCPECAKVPDSIARDLGISRVELYRMRKLVDADPETRRLVKDGKISAERATRIVMNLKEENRSKQVAIVKKAIEEDMTTRDVEDYVAEINTPKLIKSHAKGEFIKASKHLKATRNKISGDAWEDVEIRDLFVICDKLLRDIKKKAGGR